MSDHPTYSRFKTNPIPSLSPPHPFPLPLITPKTIHESPLHTPSPDQNNIPNHHSPNGSPYPRIPPPRIHPRPGTFNHLSKVGENLLNERRTPLAYPRSLSFGSLVGYVGLKL